MIVRTIEEITGTEREVNGHGFTSLRLLLERDGLGFSVHKTVIPSGGPYRWHYKHHLEACYCICGEGELENISTGELWLIEPDTLYALDAHDVHEFTAFTDVILISIFNPPVQGNEVHQNDGSYARPESVGTASSQPDCGIGINRRASVSTE
jgi:L-ectoine synthase